MEIRVIHAGMQTTVQDLGRRGFLAQGIPNGGAADPFALRVANLLVGNAEDAAGLEITFTGPVLEASEPAWFAVCGARFEGVPSWRPVRLGKGERLAFGRRLQGCRAYLAVAGGLDIEPVLGGKGTLLSAGIGGHRGRALRDGDLLLALPSTRVPQGHWSIDERMLPRYSPEPVVRAIPGSHADEFASGFLESRFAVSPRSDRMGMRLNGPKLARSHEAELVSSAVVPGTVQVPPDGNPIVLMADAQTLGGYPRIAHVIGVDQPLLAQLAPGDSVRFAAASLAEAHALAHAQERNFGLLQHGLAEKLRPA